MEERAAPCCSGLKLIEAPRYLPPLSAGGASEYLDGTQCKKCSSRFGSKCLACTKNACSQYCGGQGQPKCK